MKKILIPTDFSETAMNAIKYALELFKYDKSEFLIMHAFADEVYENSIEMSRHYFEEYKEQFQENIDNKLQKVLTEILEISPNPRHKYNKLSCFGSLVDETNALVDKENFDLIVMGTKGKTNNSKLTFGSQTLQVAKYVKSPVLIVPKDYHDMHPKNILFPTDLMISFRRRELKLLSNIAMNYVSTIHLLHMTEFEKLSHRQEDNRTFLDCCFDNNKFTYNQTKGQDITTTINKVLSEQKIDMLVLVNHRHSYLENMLYNSTIEKMGLNIKIPFLVLQNLHREL